jgi:hypothetical protein
LHQEFRKIQVGIKKNMAIKPGLSPLYPKAEFFSKKSGHRLKQGRFLKYQGIGI